MATYLMLMKWTEQGASDIAEAKRGREAGKKAAAAMGIKWKQSYLVMGNDYDVIVVVEAPDEEAMARYALLGQMSGAVETKTIRAFTEPEADKLVGSLSEFSKLVA